jgi:hypothetical protein
MRERRRGSSFAPQWRGLFFPQGDPKVFVQGLAFKVRDEKRPEEFSVVGIAHAAATAAAPGPVLREFHGLGVVDGDFFVTEGETLFGHSSLNALSNEKVK